MIVILRPFVGFSVKRSRSWARLRSPLISEYIIEMPYPDDHDELGHHREPKPHNGQQDLPEHFLHLVPSQLAVEMNPRALTSIVNLYSFLNLNIFYKYF